MSLFVSSQLRTLVSLETLGTVSYSGMPSHDGSSGASTLSDSSRSFPVDGFIGGTVYNLTDGSSGTITDNDATTVTATLAGGTDNDWDSSDTYLIMHPQNGIFFSDDMQIQITSLNNLPQSVSRMHVAIEIEQEAMSADQSDYTTSLIQSSSSQASRNVAEGRVLYMENSDSSDRRILFIRPNSATVYGITAITDSSTVASTTLLCSQAIDREFTSQTGVTFAKFVVSADQEETKCYVNRTQQISLSTSGSWDESVFNTFRIGQNGSNVSIGDFWVRNIEFHDDIYYPWLDGISESKKGTFRVATFGDSMIKKWIDPQPVNNISQVGYQIQQLFAKNGFEVLTYDHGHNGHGWSDESGSPLNSADINAMADDEPRFIFIGASVNDLTSSGVVYSSYDDYEEDVTTKINLIANISSCRFILPYTIQAFVNSAASAGFSGTNTIAEYHYNNPESINQMNSLWMGLQNNSNLSALAKEKLLPTVEIDRILGANTNGQGYPRAYTIASDPNRVAAEAGDLHETQLAMLTMAPVFGNIAFNALTNTKSNNFIRGII